MGLNLSGLRNFNKELADRSGSKLYLQQNKLTEATDFRILPPLPALDGLYFMEVVVWWINKKRYISPETYGMPCPIQAEVDHALNSKDPDVKALASDKDVINKKSEFWIPGLQLDAVMEGEDVADFKVVDGKAKILTCGPALMKRINKAVTSRKAQNGTPNGITDREKGSNLILSKTGQKLNTEYDAELGENWVFDAKYYETENIPDISQMVSDALRPDEFLEGVVRNYLYGEEMPVDPIKDKSEEEDKKPSKKAAAPAAKRQTEKDALPKTNVRRPAPAPVAVEEEEEYEEEEEEGELEEAEEEQAPKRNAVSAPKEGPAGRKTPPRPAPGKRNLMDDLNNLD